MSTAEVPKELDLIDFLVNKGNGVKGLSQMDLKTIPQKFIQPHEERLNFSQILSSESIPILDFTNINDLRVAESICDAAEKWGFFQIFNHGIPTEVLENVIEAGHKFFELPVEERRKYLKENSPTHTVQLNTSFSPLVEKVLEWRDLLFHIYDSDDDESTKLWPAVSKDQVLEYMKWAKPIIVKLLKVLLERLNVKQIDELMKSVVMGTLIINLIHYPVCPSPELTAGSGRHADIFVITMLLQDDVGGLYVREPKGDGWIHVPPVKGALVINIGDVFQIMSNARNQVLEYMKWAKPIIVKLLEVLLERLNVKQIDEPMKSVVMGKLIVNLIHYPMCPSPELTAGSGRHADISVITMLLQDDVGGLYVREPKGDGWIHVPPVKGALVIHIGDVLQIMSNDRYKSIEHRVIVNASRNRVSVPIFVNPAPDAVFGPLTQVLENGGKPLYKQVVYSDYFNYFFSKGHDGKQTIEFARL